MNDLEPRPETSGAPDLFAVLGEWGDLLHKIPGVGKAVAKMVGASARAVEAWVDVSAAKGEHAAQNVRDQTEARSRLRQSMTDAAIKQIETDPDLGRRALEHFASELVSSQSNREAVTAFALDELRREPPEEDVVDSPGDDWLNMFSIYAERASSNLLRRQWGAILAGEIRRPGSVSMLTIKMLSVMDTNFAQIIADFMRFALQSNYGRMIPMVGRFCNDPDYDALLALDGVGFLRLGNHAFDDEDLRLGRYTFRHVYPSSYRQVNGAVFTRAGNELASLIGQHASLDDAKSLLDEFRQGSRNQFDVLDADSGEILIPWNNTNVGAGE